MSKRQEVYSMYESEVSELANFVLTECGDMEFQLIVDVENKQMIITISKGFDIERIYYFSNLADEKFKIRTMALDLQEMKLNDSDFSGGWLEKMKLDLINFFGNNLSRVPKFNDAWVKRIYIDEGVDYDKYGITIVTVGDEDVFDYIEIIDYYVNEEESGFEHEDQIVILSKNF